MEKLGIFYGWPILVNGARSLEAAVAEYEKFDHVVLGDGIWDKKHGAHEDTQKIITLARDVCFYGYVTIGQTEPGNPKFSFHTPQEIERQVDAWDAMGVVGIFFDEFGFDYAPNKDRAGMRVRQNLALMRCHDRRLKPVMNAWNPDDLFLTDRVQTNPGDVYFLESLGMFPEARRIRQLMQLPMPLGIEFWSTSYKDQEDSRWLAEQLGLDAFGAAANEFYGSSDNCLPWQFGERIMGI